MPNCLLSCDTLQNFKWNSIALVHCKQGKMPRWHITWSKITSHFKECMCPTVPFGVACVYLIWYQRAAVDTLKYILLPNLRECSFIMWGGTSMWEVKMCFTRLGMWSLFLPFWEGFVSGITLTYFSLLGEGVNYFSHVLLSYLPSPN